MIRTPNTASADGLRINSAAIANAAAELGLSLPIIIKWSNGRRKLGCHRYRNGQHHITVTRFYRKENAQRLSETLWHELTHAQQVEGFINDGKPYSDFYAEYRAETARHGKGFRAYQANRFEVEARENGAAYSATHPLVHGQAAAAAATAEPEAPAAPKPAATNGVGTGHVIAVQRKRQSDGHIIQVIDGKLATALGTAGGRWIVKDTVTGRTVRYAGKREACRVGVPTI